MKTNFRLKRFFVHSSINEGFQDWNPIETTFIGMYLTEDSENQLRSFLRKFGLKILKKDFHITIIVSPVKFSTKLLTNISVQILPHDTHFSTLANNNIGILLNSNFLNTRHKQYSDIEKKILERRGLMLKMLKDVSFHPHITLASMSKNNIVNPVLLLRELKENLNFPLVLDHEKVKLNYNLPDYMKVVWLKTNSVKKYNEEEMRQKLLKRQKLDELNEKLKNIK